MRINSSTRFVTLAALAGALACAGNTARTDESAAAKDTTTTGRDTLNGQTENPPGYRGMERDTTQVPNGATQAPVDTFLQKQGTGSPQDTAGYSGIERDTTGQSQQNQQQNNGQVTNQPTQSDTSSMRNDTTGAGGVSDTSMTNGGAADTSGYNQSTGNQNSTSGNQNSANPSSSTTGLDSTGMSKTGDTTGYDKSQQQRDSTSR
jgi:hypothetical protein